MGVAVLVVAMSVFAGSLFLRAERAAGSGEAARPIRAATGQHSVVAGHVTNLITQLLSTHPSVPLPSPLQPAPAHPILLPHVAPASPHPSSPWHLCRLFRLPPVAPSARRR